MSAVEKMVETGRAKWLTQGRAEGRVEGRAEGQAALLLKLLTLRFGLLPPDLEARVLSATTDELERWAALTLPRGCTGPIPSFCEVDREMGNQIDYLANGMVRDLVARRDSGVHHRSGPARPLPG